MKNNLFSYMELLFSDGNIPSDEELDRLSSLVTEGKSDEELKKIYSDFYRDGFMREMLDQPLYITLSDMTLPLVEKFKNPDYDVLKLHAIVTSTAYIFGITNSRAVLDKRNHFSIDQFRHNLWENKKIRKILKRTFFTLLEKHKEFDYVEEECIGVLIPIFILILKVTAEYRTKTEIFDIFYRYYEPMDWRKLSGLTDRELEKYNKQESPVVPPYAKEYQAIVDANFQNYKFQKEKAKTDLRIYREELSNNNKYPDSLAKAAEIVKIYHTYCKFQDFKTDDQSLENYSYEEVYAYNEALKGPDFLAESVYIANLILFILYNSRMPGDKDFHHLCTHHRLSQCIAYAIYPYSLKVIEAMNLYTFIQNFSTDFTYPQDLPRAFRHRLTQIKRHRDQQKE